MSVTRTISSICLAGDFNNYRGESFLGNKLSGSDTKEMACRAASVCVHGVERIAQAGASGLYFGHVSRDLMRNCKFPSLFFADMSGWDCKHDQPTTCKMPFLSVHGFLAALASKSSDFVGQCCSVSSFPVLEEEIAGFCRGAVAKCETVIPVGFHFDGVPKKRRKSIQVFSRNVLHDPSYAVLFFCTMEKQSMCRCGCMTRSLSF